VEVVEQVMPPMRLDLVELFDPDELAKYFTKQDMAVLEAGEWPPTEPREPLTDGFRAPPDAVAAHGRRSDPAGAPA
jgi:hypothetical protein